MTFAFNMNSTQFQILVDALNKLNTNMAQLVSIQTTSNASILKHMTIDDALFQQILDAGNLALAAESADMAAQAAAKTASDAVIAALQAQVAPNPALVAAAQQFLANAAAANPPAVPVAPAAPAAPAAV